jgi:hypothetical protein
MNKISIIIPTMWKSYILSSALKEYINSEFISEVILIDNEPSSKFEVPISDKIKIYTKNENIYVNPSWNWGVDLSSNNNLIFANDDICIKNLDSLITKFLDYDDCIIGLDYSKINTTEEINFEISEGHMCKGFGCFFFLNKKNYFKIPDDLKIFYGDVILYNSIKNRIKFSCSNITIKMSTTSNYYLDYFKTIEKPIFKSKYEKIYRLL